MFTLTVHNPGGVVTIPLKEPKLINIKITNGTSQNVLIFTPQEVFNLPGDTVWTLTNDAGPARSGMEALAEVTDLEDLETLLVLLQEGIGRTPGFKRQGAAKNLVAKLKGLIKNIKA